MVRVVVEHLAKSREDAEKVVNIILQLRNEAIKQNGYITGETLIDLDQPRNVLVISTWDKAESWQAWDKSELRTSLTRPIFSLLEKPYSVKLYSFATIKAGRVSSIY
jgi:heme oxygenase (mycobilin-producing)